VETVFPLEVAVEFVIIERHNSTAAIMLTRGRVNAIDQRLVSELSTALSELVEDASVTSLVLTGRGKFFSFGLDVPALYDLTPDEFTSFLQAFCGLCRDLFLFPKPIVAAINGHAMAGGCVLTLPCDMRIAPDIAASISLNEVTLGASLFASTVELLRYWVRNQEAEQLLLTGRMIDAKEALRIGLVDQIVEASNLLPVALSRAGELAAHYGPGYVALRRLIRQPVADRWLEREDESIKEFVRIWYTPETRHKTRQVQIRP
jgi:enoyl-CoA hydratase/carnithine racemase